MAAPPTARVKSVKLRAEVFENNDVRPLTEEELNSIALRQPSVTLQNDSGKQVTHRASNGAHFTVRELLNAVEETERKLRAETEWLGGVDVHHIYFEGIEPIGPATFQILWGS